MIGNTDIRRVAKLVSVDQLAELLPGLQKIIEGNPDAVVAITDQGKPVMALLSWESWEDTEDLAAGMESLEIMGNAEKSGALRQSRPGADADDLVPGDIVLQQLIDKGLIDADGI